AKLTSGNVLDELIAAGFDAVYDDHTYALLKEISKGTEKWANDLVSIPFGGPRFANSVRYTENHDEVRIANPNTWGGHGMAGGRPATAFAFLIGPGPVMLYHGQEVGEPAIGASGFSGDDGRTSIFD